MAAIWNRYLGVRKTVQHFASLVKFPEIYWHCSCLATKKKFVASIIEAYIEAPQPIVEKVFCHPCILVGVLVMIIKTAVFFAKRPGSPSSSNKNRLKRFSFVCVSKSKYSGPLLRFFLSMKLLLCNSSIRR